MSPTQDPQALPSFKLALRSDHHRTLPPNLSYPSRPHTHIPWSGSSAPLLFAKTTRPETTISAGNANIQVPTTASINTWSILDAFHGISALVWHKLSMIVRNLKLIKENLFGVGATNPPATTSV